MRIKSARTENVRFIVRLATLSCMFRDVCTFSDIQFGRLVTSEENPLVLRMRDDYDFQDYFLRHSSVLCQEKEKKKKNQTALLA